MLSADRPTRHLALLEVELSRYNKDVAALSKTRFEWVGSLEEKVLGNSFF